MMTIGYTFGDGRIFSSGGYPGDERDNLAERAARIVQHQLGSMVHGSTQVRAHISMVIARENAARSHGYPLLLADDSAIVCTLVTHDELCAAVARAREEADGLDPASEAQLAVHQRVLRDLTDLARERATAVAES